MKKTQQKINSKPRNISHKCSECSEVSKSVFKSIKYNKYLCTDCLKNIILNTTE